MAQPQDDSNKYLEDSFPQQNPNLDIESSAMLSGGGERGGLGTIFQMLNDLATENSSDSVLVANSNANFSQILEEATSAPEVSLSSQEVINQFGDCSVVTSSQTYPSCRFEGLVNEEAFDQNQTVQSTSNPGFTGLSTGEFCHELFGQNQNLRDDGSDVSTSRLEFGSNRDEKYWERRRKNNMAAKKSRDARRVRENQLRLKVLCLENANQVLRTQVEKERQKNKELTSKVQDLEKKLQTSDRLSTS